MTRFEALVSLNLIGDIGSIGLKKLLEFFDKPQNLFKTPQEKLVKFYGISQNLAARISSLKKQDIDREFEFSKKHGLKIITLGDKAYPANLKNIPGAPLVLYVKGELRQEDNYSIAIVGSRRASFYGLTNAEKFAFELSNKGFTIVSGMARGIDTYAHRGSLRAGARTIAVIGSGFNHIYPAENKELAEKIAQKGAVISEFPIDTLPLKQNFPRRNRIISGLSLGVLIAEAAKNSGALITADFALEQGREVFALPGQVNSRTSFGTNGLIKQGAKLVSCVDDILEEFAPVVIKQGDRCPNSCEDGTRLVPQTVQEKGEVQVYGLISDKPLALDELLEKTRMDIPGISGILLRLQMKRLIKQLPGKQFVRSQHEE